MSDISQLLKEAKPLYFKRKKRRRLVKMASGIVGSLMVAVVLTGIPNRHQVPIDLEGYYAYLYDDAAYNNALGSVDTSLTDWFSIDGEIV